MKMHARRGGFFEGENERWTSPWSPADAKPNARSHPVASMTWDYANASRLLRIMTLNMHGRPLDVTTATATSKGGLECDDEYHLANGQQRRMRGLFEWLDALRPEERPHILCLQEVIWEPMIDIAEPMLAARGFTTFPGIALGKDRGCRTCWPPRAGSGLAIYVQRTAGLHCVDGDRMVFAQSLGADWLVDKGLKWALVRCTNPQLVGPSSIGWFVVVTMHPQAYTGLRSVPPPGEVWWAGGLRRLAALEVWLRGGSSKSVVSTHAAQYEQAAEYLRMTVLPRVAKQIGTGVPLLGVFVAADMNVNRYATAPQSPEEADPTCAATSPVSREFRAVLQTLGCRQPPILRDHTHAAPQGGRFTWDGAGNSLATPLVPVSEAGTQGGEAPGFAWIDSVLVCDCGVDGGSDNSNVRVKKPVYADNRCIAVRLKHPVPEVAPFWTTHCYRWRNRALQQHSGLDGQRRSAYGAVNRMAMRRLTIGQRQLHALVTAFSFSQQKQWSPRALLAVQPAAWVAFVQAAPTATSSQIWKGAGFYGLLPTDAHAELVRNLPVGAPHPFRLIYDVSDHHAVMARIALKTS